MKVKLDDKGNLVFVNGNLVLLDDAGAEVFFHSPESVNALHVEAATFKKAAEDTAKALKGFDGVTLAEVKELRTLRDSNADLKQKVEQVRAQITESFEGKVSELSKAISDKDSVLRKLSVSSKFSSSKVLDSTIFADMREVAESHFGSAFEVKEDGSVVAKVDGKDVWSKKFPGQIADFDEALLIMLESSDKKSKIFVDAGVGGTGLPAGDRSPAFNPAINPWKKETLNLTNQSRIASTNPTLASRMKAEAGIV